MTPPAETTQSSMAPRLDYLDSVRGLAALAVLVGHYFRGYGFPSHVPAWLWHTPFSIVQDGFAAVSMFFVLSGLVLSLKYMRDRGALRAKDVGPFLVRRVARILFPFLAVLWLAAALQALAFKPYSITPSQTSWLLSFWQGSQTPLSVLKQSFLFLQAGSPHRLLPQDWSLTVELNVSVWTPLLVAIAMHSMTGLLLAALVGIVVFGFHGLLLPFTMGVLLARVFERLRSSTFLQRRWVFLGLIGTGLLLYSCRGSVAALPAAWPISERWIWYVTDLGAVLLLVALIGAPYRSGLLHLKALTHLGRISYSIYLWHFPVLMCVTPALLSLSSRWASGVRRCRGRSVSRAPSS